SASFFIHCISLHSNFSVAKHQSQRQGLHPNVDKVPSMKFIRVKQLYLSTMQRDRTEISPPRKLIISDLETSLSYNGISSRVHAMKSNSSLRRTNSMSISLSYLLISISKSSEFPPAGDFRLGNVAIELGVRGGNGSTTASYCNFM